MTRQEREDIAKLVCNFDENAASHSVKATINYFSKRHIPERTSLKSISHTEQPNFCHEKVVQSK